MRWLVSGDEVVDLLAPYAAARRAQPAGRPWVLANMVTGLDGSAAFGGRVGPLSQGADVELFRLVRALADVVLVGAATVRAEGYGPVQLAEDRQAARAAAGKAPLPVLAIVSRSLDLDWRGPAFAAGAPRALVVTCAAADPQRLAQARKFAEVIQVGGARVDLAGLLGAFAGRGWSTVLCEGGPTLLGELVAADLLDELCLTVAPVMGGDQLTVALAGAGGARRFRLRHTLTDGGSLFLRYERDRRRR